MRSAFRADGLAPPVAVERPERERHVDRVRGADLGCLPVEAVHEGRAARAVCASATRNAGTRNTTSVRAASQISPAGRSGSSLRYAASTASGSIARPPEPRHHAQEPGIVEIASTGVGEQPQLVTRVADHEVDRHVRARFGTLRSGRRRRAVVERGWNGITPVASPSSANTASCAVSTASTGVARATSPGRARPRAASELLAHLLRELRGERSRLAALDDGPPNRRRFAADAVRCRIEPAPADSPNTVIRSGSPPNAGACVAHPREGGELVAQPAVRVAVTVGVATRYPSAPSR